MRKFIPIVLVLLGLVGAAHAQIPNGVTVSTDPAKAAAVERHAAELKSMQSPAAHQAVQTKHHRTMHQASHTSGHKASHRPAKHNVKATGPVAARK